MRECVFCHRKLGKKKNRKVEYFDGWQHQPMKCSFISDLNCGQRTGDKAQQTLPSLQTSSWSVIDMLRLVTKALLNNERTVLNHYKSFHFSFFSSGKVKNLTYLFGNINIISAEDCATSTDFEIRSNYFQYSDIFLSFLVFHATPIIHP